MLGLSNILMMSKIMESIPDVDKDDIITFVERFIQNKEAEEITFQDIINYARKNSGNLKEEILNDEIHNRVINLVWEYYDEFKKIESDHYHKVLLTIMKRKVKKK